MHKLNLILWMVWITGILTAVTVDPAGCAITVADAGSSIHRLAAKELQLHLRLVTGREIPIVHAHAAGGRYVFHVGKQPGGFSASFKPEEGCRLITPGAAYFFGDDYQYGSVRPEADLAQVFNNLTRSGTLFAVYDFLENVLGIHWITPGESGIVCRRSGVLELPEGFAFWSPRLAQRQIRSGYSWAYYERTLEKSTPEYFRISKADYTRLEDDNKLWFKRMRMGRHLILNYGHTFVNWWEKYGQTHPEYFALTEKGERKPLYPEQPDRIKMCVSNPALHAQIVNDWWKARTNAKLKQLYNTINV